VRAPRRRPGAGGAPGRHLAGPLTPLPHGRRGDRREGRGDRRRPEAPDVDPGKEKPVKAAVLFKANTPLEIVDLTQEGPRAGEARVKVKAAGICHSDWHIMNGDWTPPLPIVPGDHIIFSFRPHCGRCLYCSIGRSILCDGHTSPRWGMLDGSYRLKNKGQDIYQMARIGTFSER